MREVRGEREELRSVGGPVTRTGAASRLDAPSDLILDAQLAREIPRNTGGDAREVRSRHHRPARSPVQHGTRLAVDQHGHREQSDDALAADVRVVLVRDLPARHVVRGDPRSTLAQRPPAEALVRAHEHALIRVVRGTGDRGEHRHSGSLQPAEGDVEPGLSSEHVHCFAQDALHVILIHSLHEFYPLSEVAHANTRFLGSA
ncbi:hypothetical protein [Leucobacter manosquensis]|uniref:Uncharacterized protein n=1 Tax=Leucobacter manosquensis TaxID=2810611 RepID=A0ABS5M0E9_9MICO|nr:hypothetical protein [Leucobacter manosquensis]MBS3180673.1 hypothetical protein [Leucobacter manosquensis]